jgi:hypothetical protein
MVRQACPDLAEAAHHERGKVAHHEQVKSPFTEQVKSVRPFDSAQGRL